MAKISKEDLIHLSNSDIKLCFTVEDRTKLPSPVKEFVEEGKDDYTMGARINRTEKLLMNIIVNRFIKGELSDIDIETIKLKTQYQLLSKLESEFPRNGQHKVLKEIRNMMGKILNELNIK